MRQSRNLGLVGNNQYYAYFTDRNFTFRSDDSNPNYIVGAGQGNILFDPVICDFEQVFNYNIHKIIGIGCLFCYYEIIDEGNMNQFYWCIKNKDNNIIIANQEFDLKVTHANRVFFGYYIFNEKINKSDIQNLQLELGKNNSYYGNYHMKDSDIVSGGSYWAQLFIIGTGSRQENREKITVHVSESKYKIDVEKDIENYKINDILKEII